MRNDFYVLGRSPRRPFRAVKRLLQISRHGSPLTKASKASKSVKSGGKNVSEKSIKDGNVDLPR